MLGKLIKNELKATARMFLPLYGLLIILTFVNKFVFELPQKYAATEAIIKVISALLYTAIITAIVALSFIMLIQRFHKNLLQDEGYLMHTLPVTAGQHIVSKLLVSLLWNMLSTVVVTFSVLYMATDAGDWGSFFDTLWNGLATLAQEAGTTPQWVLCNLVVLVLAYAVCKTLMLYAAMGLGQRFANKAKIGAAIGFAVLLNLAEQIIPILLFTAVDRFWPNLLIDRIGNSHTMFITMFWYLLASALVFSGLYAFLANNSLKKHLNLA